MAKSDFFAHVENGELLEMFVPRGGQHHGKHLGKESDDSVYADKHNLYPMIDNPPAYDPDTQTRTGPVWQWNASEERVDGAYTVTDKPVDDLKQAGRNEVNAIRAKRLFGGIPFTTTTTPTNGDHVFTRDANEIMSIKIAALDVQASNMTFTEATGGYWKSNDNVEVKMSEAEFQSLSVTAGKFLVKMSRESHNAKKAIDALPANATKAQIDAIVTAYRNYDPLA